ncbi:TAXI family TRAP transporter solute-binding subunit [Nisaea sp.]|uniref:TAXI family TRAP transporter solute-binding subunit n=1 Tax=Nisaea sp. TaxID=2024842 RepID=UPI002B26FCEC|nr:TAXI family TRAP transporter solute-binding subunit [Nisaea sp.]
MKKINKLLRAGLLGTALTAATLFAADAGAETRVTYKSAKSTSSYYQMAVQVAEAVKKATGGAMVLTVEESQGSVQNVKESARRPGNYVFTTPPVLVKLAMANKGKFEGDTDYKSIRALFPIPSLTMHFVVRADSGVNSFADLDGKSFIIGKGSFGAREAAKNFTLFGLEGKVKLVDAELNAAVPALKNRQVDGFATAGSYPAPNVIEAAAGTEVRLLSMSEEQIKQTKRTKLVIPAGTYPGIDTDVNTTSLPVVAYTTTNMSDDDAYTLTKAYWDAKGSMGKTAKWWDGVKPEMLANVIGKLHPGAARYYAEAGVAIPDAIK